MTFLADPKDHICRLFLDDIVVFDVEDNGVDKHDRVYRAERPPLPGFDFWQQLVGYARHHTFADFKPINLIYLV